MSEWTSSRVSSLAPSIIRAMSDRRGPRSVDLSLGQPGLSPDRALLMRAIEAMDRTSWGYTANAGLTELRAAIAAHHAIPGRTEAENVLVTVGSEEAVFLTMLGGLEPGDEVLIPEPGYPAYPGIARMLEAVPVTYPIQRETGLVARAEALQARLTSRTRGIVLNSPSNPFGRFESERELRRIVELAEANDLWILSDEIYRDLVYTERPFVSLGALTPRARVVGGLSKSCAMTGFRLGYLIAAAEVVRKTALAHQLVATCAPRVSQHMALEIFRHPEHLTAHVPFYAEARRAAEEAAADLPPDAPLFLGDGAFYAILDVSRYCSDAYPFAVELLEAEDVVVVPGVAFGPSGGWFWRLSYAGGADLVREGLKRIARFLSSR